MKKAFMMVELIFVIVIIGILASIAIPRFSVARDDALIAKNNQYISGIMTEISVYIIAKSESKPNLVEMSSILKILKKMDRIVIDTVSQSVKVKIGEEVGCISISIDSNGTTETLGTSFIPTTDRICNNVQLAIKEKDYPLVLRGRLIKY